MIKGQAEVKLSTFNSLPRLASDHAMITKRHLLKQRPGLITRSQMTSMKVTRVTVIVSTVKVTLLLLNIFTGKVSNLKETHLINISMQEVIYINMIKQNQKCKVQEIETVSNIACQRAPLSIEITTQSI